MSRTVGAIGWKTKQKYLHEKFPDQGWMEETDKKVVNEHYREVKTKEEDDNGIDYSDGPWAEGWEKRAS